MGILAEAGGQLALLRAGVSWAGFHAWLHRPTRRRVIHDATPVTAIETRFRAGDRT
ncbi:hypothetical protein [Pseudogemmobacter bohemicus]|uniref:hypothetical protein n=1 Tax=Pseudogemmobacter bohemicus TaxID=2250708 RepID=UPI00130033F3|nr:hypothetical protein [Pseudogemmobacter bohemicus]